MIPFEPGVGKLSPMTWPWLVGTPVALFVFIAGVMGFPPSVDANVQLVRRLMSLRAKKSAVQPALMGASSISRLTSSPTRNITFGSEGEKKPAVRSGATVSLTPPRKTNGVFPGWIGRPRRLHDQRQQSHDHYYLEVRA